MENNLGQRIAFLRKKNRWSQAELAAMLNVSDKSVSKWENGGMPGIDLLPKLSKIFNVSIDYLLMGEGEEVIEVIEVIEEPVKNNDEVNSLVKGLSIDDISLILADQRDLYTDEELKILQERYDELANEEIEEDDDCDEYDEEDDSNNVGCWAYIIALLFPLVGFIIGLVYKSRGLIILSVLLMLIESIFVLSILGSTVLSVL